MERFSHVALTAEQEAEAERMEQAILEASRAEMRAMARLLSSKPDRELLGEREFPVRDLCHRIGAAALETALVERKKGGTKGRAGRVHAAGNRRDSTGTGASRG